MVLNIMKFKVSFHMYKSVFPVGNVMNSIDILYIELHTKKKRLSALQVASGDAQK